MARQPIGTDVVEGGFMRAAIAALVVGFSRMGDFTSVMTVRQLVDITAFLREHARR